MSARFGLALAALVAASASADERLDAAVLKRVKDSSALLRVLNADRSAAEGSGFFAIEAGLLVTNAHVVGMNVPGSKKPIRVFVIRANDPDERPYSATVLGVDPVADLAVLRVEGDNPPQPLPIVNSATLQETQTVYVFGYPFGSILGKGISVRRATVSSLRRVGNSLDQVQIEGGIDQGNSGGPIVDAAGNVVGVSVSKIRATQINFAVPTEKVTDLIRGKAEKPFLGIPFRDADAVKLPVRVALMDPLGKTKKVVLESWTGKDDAPRPDEAEPAAVDLPIKDGVASGEVKLPSPKAGQAVWVRSRVESADGTKSYEEARKVTSQTPVDRKLAVLKFQPPAKGQGRLKIEMKTPAKTPMQVRSSEAVGKLSIDLSGSANEASAGAQTRWGFTELTFTKTLDDTTAASLPRDAKPVADLLFDRTGAVSVRVPTAKSPEATFAEHLQFALAFAAPPLADKDMEAGKTWERKVPVTVNLIQQITESATADMKFTYEGTRPGPGGREELLVTSEGLVTSAAGKPGAALHGFYVLDRDTGRVTRGFVQVTFDLDSTVNGRTFTLTGELKIDLRRGFAAPAEEEKK